MIIFSSILVGAEIILTLPLHNNTYFSILSISISSSFRYLCSLVFYNKLWNYFQCSHCCESHIFMNFLTSSFNFLLSTVLLPITTTQFTNFFLYWWLQLIFEVGISLCLKIPKWLFLLLTTIFTLWLYYTFYKIEIIWRLQLWCVFTLV